jgi:monoamine oxidase
MKESERVSFTLEQMSKVHPALRENFEGGASKCWDEDEWARGGYMWYKPGQGSSLLPHIARPEGVFTSLAHQRGRDGCKGH